MRKGNSIKLYIYHLFIQLVLGLFAFTCFGQKQKLEGFVLDSITKQGLPYASVSVYQIGDTSIVTGAITDIEGKYEIKGLDKVKYRLVSSYMGYNSATKIIDVNSATEIVDFKLTPNMLTLSEVEIAGEKNLVESNLERINVNVSKDLSIKGGSGIDALQTVPSVDVDVDGNIRYRGSDKVIILINGEKSELVKSLDQIPADRIEKIEIINNPSAKYDAEGMSGIINIVLKKADKGINNSTFQLFAGYSPVYGGNIGYSGGSEKLFFTIGAGYSHKSKFQTKEHFRSNYENPDANDFYQFDRRDENNNSILLNTNVEYRFNQKHKLNLSVIGSSLLYNAKQTINYETLGQESILINEAKKDVDILLDNYSFDATLNYGFEFNEKGHGMSAGVYYNLFWSDSKMHNEYFETLTVEEPEVQNTVLEQSNSKIGVNVDYRLPISDSVLFEAGYNYDKKDLLNDFNSNVFFDYLNYSSGWVANNDLGHSFNYVQNINAAYISLNALFPKFRILAGLRTEYTGIFQSDQNSRDYFDYFPSASVIYQKGEKIKPYFSYNRRINRPSISMLNPYTEEYVDLLNLHKGNPDLMPEYVNSIETGAKFISEKLSFTPAVYYRHINNAISRIKYAENDSALVVTYMNLENADMIGAELNAYVKPVKWWNLNFSVNAFNTSLNGTYQNNIVNHSRVAWNTNFTNQFKLPAGINIQLSAYYRSKLPSVLGVYEPRYYADVAISKRLFDNNAQLVFRVSDIFNTYIFGLDIDAIDLNNYSYSQTNRRKNESRYFVLSFVFNVNHQKSNSNSKGNNFFLEEFDK